MNKLINTNQVKKTLSTKAGKVSLFLISQITKLGFNDPSRLPFSIKILLENVLRNCDNYQVTAGDIKTVSEWTPELKNPKEIAYKPGRVILQDFTGVPCVVDLASMRSAVKRLGGNTKKINPQVPCDLIIDHSLQIDAFGSKKAFDINVAKEFKRNKERYEFLKWGQNTFKNFRVVPPATGIIHQVNLEYWAKGVLHKKTGNEMIAYPDTCIGTDSHTTMVNGLGVLGWGVGGIEAEAVMLGEPITMLLPEVIGFKLTGKLKHTVNATDLVLTVVEMLRKKGVVGKFVEFYGDGIKNLTLADRATVSNMGPEYGATIGIFPVDDETLKYYRMTGRTDAEVDLIERYMKEQGLFHNPNFVPKYTDTLELDLSKVEPSLAGPKRPQDRIPLSKMTDTFKKTIGKSKKSIKVAGTKESITNGSVVIASITSCTNTSNPSVLIGAGLLAKKAVEKGLQIKKFVKTSFVPGSQVVEDYLKAADILGDLEKLGFHIVGYGCATCIGNSGPLPAAVERAIKKGDLITANVLSGNRNFEGRISPVSKANYLASPALVVAYALAGTVDVNLTKDPIGKGKDGTNVYLKDIWPSQDDIDKLISKSVKTTDFRKRYGNVAKSNKNWNSIKSGKSELFAWKKSSTYIQEPPFFMGMTKEAGHIREINSARCLVMVGDSITTDHISPAGVIAPDSSAGKYLKSLKVKPVDFNSYGSRRGNDRVMTRGTFANVRLRNRLAPNTEGAWTIHFPTKKKMTIYDASLAYKKDNVPLVVLAGKEYGTGSSRDWAAKGTALLGVRVVVAQSYERIHRSNLAGMGILPLQFKEGDSSESLGLTGEEVFDFAGVNDDLRPRQEISVIATSQDGTKKKFSVICRLDTPIEVEYFRNGGILQTVIRKLI